MAEAIDKLTAARASGVGLDVVYAEPSDPEQDRRLASAIARNGRVVLPALLYDTETNRERNDPAAHRIAWLRPLPELERAACAVGHAHVSPGVDGMVRSIQLSKADDRAERVWALGLEVVRAAERINTAQFEEHPTSLRLGPYRIPVHDETDVSRLPGVSVIRPNEMSINFIGPTGSFRSLSIADLIDGRIPLSEFSDRIVLIGATAESMGDRRVAPFMHYSGERSLGGQQMPGVEIHANIINSIRRRLSFQPLPEWAEFAAVLAVILCAALTIHLCDGRRQALLLGLLLAAIGGGSLIAFSRYLILPPLAPMLTGFLAVIPLLLNRQLAASRELDIRLAALIESQQGFPSNDGSAEEEFIERQFGLDLPQNLGWKLRAVDELMRRLLARASFDDRVLSSMGEGVMVADRNGRIVFANREAANIFDGGGMALTGLNLYELLCQRTVIDQTKLREAIAGVDGGRLEPLEFQIQSAAPRYYSLSLSTLIARRKREETTGGAADDLSVVAMISDLTRHVELDRMKTETLQLVSHELRRPPSSPPAAPNSPTPGCAPKPGSRSPRSPCCRPEDS